MPTNDYAPQQRNIVIAYVLWFFLGQLGIHRFYCGKTASGIFQVILAVIGWATVAIFIGYLFLFILGFWLFIDIFLIPSMCKHPN